MLASLPPCLQASVVLYFLVSRIVPHGTKIYSALLRKFQPAFGCLIINYYLLIINCSPLFLPLFFLCSPAVSLLIINS